MYERARGRIVVRARHDSPLSRFADPFPATDGSVRGAKVLDSKPRGVFEASAVQAVMRWKFKPKIKDGKPVEQKGSQKIEFNLNQKAA